MEKLWYVVNTYSGHEAIVKENLKCVLLQWALMIISLE